MKVLRILMFTIYFLVYGYSAYKTTVEPDRAVWGWICALVFGILSIMAIKYFTEKSKKDKENKEEL